MGRKKKTTEIWINEAKNVHNSENYIYDDKCIYNGSNKPIIIKCNKHGYFSIIANDFLKGSGCPICANEKKKYNVQKFIEKAKEAHGDKYDYSKVEYINSKTKVCIICPEHGEFWQTPSSHLNGSGCVKCYNDRRRNVNKEQSHLFQKFIEKAKEAHGDKYDYSKVEYINSKTKVCIICPEHGEFWQTPSDHLNKRGCPICGNERRKEKLLLNEKDVINKSNQIHNNKYNYGVFNGMRNKMEIICPIHGLFHMSPMNHIYKKQGCPICGKERNNLNKIITTEEYIYKCKEIHGDKYDYSITNYIGYNKPIKFICHNLDEYGKEHGIMSQIASVHLHSKYGCKKCAGNYSPTTNEIIESFINVHGDKYDYSKVEYINDKTKVNIVCPKHGEFKQLPYVHLHGCGCPSCSAVISNDEIEIRNFIHELGFNTEDNKKDIIPPYEIDIFIPELKIGIEYDGLLWHSEKYGKDKNYHLNKLILCNNHGIKLIHIFENEYSEHKNIVIEKIRHLLKRDLLKEKIYARKCVLEEITNEEAKIFLNINHIQGFVSSSVYIGAYYNESLVSVMTFKKEKENDEWELNRFATDITKNCIGLGGKLFKYFIKKYNPVKIKSFADRRWTLDKSDNLYIKLGFKLDKILKPDYKYFGDDRVLHHKFGFRKQILIKKYPEYHLTEDMTENEMCNILGFHKVWDCGLFKYIWKMDK